jgi:hypothetical protein
MTGMRDSSLRPALAVVIGALLLAVSLHAPLPAQGRRVVDVVQVGDARSERDHEYAGDGVSDGAIGGRTFRQAAGWLRYTLRTYDDTEVTVACLCRGTDGRRLSFDLLVDGEYAGTRALESASADPIIAEYRIPERMTAGKTKIAVTLRGIGGPTPGVIELRTVQEHLE